MFEISVNREPFHMRTFSSSWPIFCLACVRHFGDDEVRKLADTLRSPVEGVDVMIEKLFGLLHMIDAMSLDYTNYMLQQAAPTLISESSGYEQRMFAQDLDNGSINLERTKRWWRHAAVNTLTESGISDVSSQASFDRIYARGLIELAVGAGALGLNDIPETLQLDRERLVRIRRDALRYTTVGAILLTAKNLLKRDVRSHWKPEAGRLVESVSDSYDNKDGNLGARILGIIESSHRMPRSSHEQLANIVARFLAESHAGHLKDPVLKLLLQRLKLHLFTRLAASSSMERVRAASTTSEGLAGIGLSEFIGQVGAMAEELAKVSGIDRAAHGVWYRQITDELDRMGAAEA